VERDWKARARDSMHRTMASRGGRVDWDVRVLRWEVAPLESAAREAEKVFLLRVIRRVIGRKEEGSTLFLGGVRALGE